MRRQRVEVWRIALLVLILATGSARAGFYQVTVGLSDLPGSDFQLQIALYDNSEVAGDSWALMDNFVLGSTRDDFESGTLEGFDDSLNEDAVGVVSGTLDGTGSFLMEIDEDPAATPTVVFRNYLSRTTNVLTFDLRMTASPDAGLFGFDELVISLLNPDTWEPLVSGLNGFGDVLSLSADGLRHTDEVTVGVVPAPGALLLGLLGIGSSGWGIWRRRERLTHPS